MHRCTMVTVNTETGVPHPTRQPLTKLKEWVYSNNWTKTDLSLEIVEVVEETVSRKAEKKETSL